MSEGPGGAILSLSDGRLDFGKPDVVAKDSRDPYKEKTLSLSSFSSTEDTDVIRKDGLYWPAGAWGPTHCG